MLRDSLAVVEGNPFRPVQRQAEHSSCKLTLQQLATRARGDFRKLGLELDFDLLVTHLSRHMIQATKKVGKTPTHFVKPDKASEKIIEQIRWRFKPIALPQGGGAPGGESALTAILEPPPPAISEARPEGCSEAAISAIMAGGANAGTEE